jgi:hypothetical protein
LVQLILEKIEKNYTYLNSTKAVSFPPLQSLQGVLNLVFEDQSLSIKTPYSGTVRLIGPFGIFTSFDVCRFTAATNGF